MFELFKACLVHLAASKSFSFLPFSAWTFRQMEQHLFIRLLFVRCIADTYISIYIYIYIYRERERCIYMYIYNSIMYYIHVTVIECALLWGEMAQRLFVSSCPPCVMYIYIYMYTHICMYISIYIYIYIYIHTYIHIHTYIVYVCIICKYYNIYIYREIYIYIVLRVRWRSTCPGSRRS